MEVEESSDQNHLPEQVTQPLHKLQTGTDCLDHADLKEGAINLQQELGNDVSQSHQMLDNETDKNSLSKQILGSETNQNSESQQVFGSETDKNSQSQKVLGNEADQNSQSQQVLGIDTDENFQSQQMLGIETEKNADLENVKAEAIECSKDVGNADSETKAPVMLKDEFTQCQQELEVTKKQVARLERQLEKVNGYNEDLRKQVESLSSQLHEYRHPGQHKEVGVQVDKEELLKYSTDVPIADWGNTDENKENKDDNQKSETKTSSIAEDLKATAEAALQQTGFVYDQNTGLYYDHNSGYYYDSEKSLYYDPTSGTYFYYDPESSEYKFHSQVNPSYYAGTFSNLGYQLPTAAAYSSHGYPHHATKDMSSHSYQQQRSAVPSSSYSSHRHDGYPKYSHRRDRRSHSGHSDRDSYREDRHRERRKKERHRDEKNMEEGSVEKYDKKKKKKRKKKKKKKEKEKDDKVLEEVKGNKENIEAGELADDTEVVENSKPLTARERRRVRRKEDRTKQRAEKRKGEILENGTVKHKKRKKHKKEKVRVHEEVVVEDEDTNDMSKQEGEVDIVDKETDHSKIENAEVKNAEVALVEGDESDLKIVDGKGPITDYSGGGDDVGSGHAVVPESSNENSSMETNEDVSNNATDSMEIKSKFLVESSTVSDQNEIAIVAKLQENNASECSSGAVEKHAGKYLVTLKVEGESSSHVNQTGFHQNVSSSASQTECEEKEKGLEVVDGDQNGSEIEQEGDNVESRQQSGFENAAETVDTCSLEVAVTESEPACKTELNENLQVYSEVDTSTQEEKMDSTEDVALNDDDVQVVGSGDQVKSKAMEVIEITSGSESGSVCTGESELESSSESESGELSDSDSSSSSSSSGSSSSSESIQEDFVEQQPEEELASTWPPCIRVIVIESDCLDVGTLFIVTCDGATIGREKSLNHAIRIPDLNVSKFHAEIKYDQEQMYYFMVDHGSVNGTIINGLRICKSKVVSEPIPLNHEDVLELGDTKLLCHIHPGTDTCDDCEPGQVMARHQASHDNKKEIVIMSKAEKIKQQRHELKMIKKKYGLKNMAYEDNSAAINNPAYADKAEERRRTVGSDHPHQKQELPASVHKPISSGNLGHKMLKKMGWKEGEGLGKTVAGIQEPVMVSVRTNQAAGLGSSLGGNISADDVQSLDRKKVERRIKAQERFHKLEEQSSQKNSTGDSTKNSAKDKTWFGGGAEFVGTQEDTKS